MKYKWKHRLIVWILTVALMLTLPVAAMADEPPMESPDPAPSETSTALDLTKTVDLTIAPGPPSMTGSEHPTRLPAANVVYDVYKVAAVEKETGMESYHFQLEPAFEGILPSGMDISTYTGLKAMDNAKWHKIAMEAAAKIFGGSFTGSPVVSASPAATTLTLNAGLYLVIARSSNLTAEADYVKWDEDTDPKTLIGTIARSDEYEYTFAPELIALPAAREEIPAVFPGDADPDYITGNDWFYEVSAMLKPQEEIRYGDLKVVKDLIVYNTNAGTTDPVSFVFRVKWEKINDVNEDEGSGSAILMLTFTGTGVKSSLLEGKIPVGAEVTVEEIYPGSGYKNTGIIIAPDTTPHVILAPENADAPLTWTFNNECENELIKGYGILNQYSYENGGWTVDNTHDSE